MPLATSSHTPMKSFPMTTKTQLIGSGGEDAGRRAWRPCVRPPVARAPDGRLPEAGRGDVDRFADPFGVLFDVRVAMLPRVRMRRRQAGEARRAHQRSMY
ncbi:hypothetical protein Skr01_05900 [Sphaerisporangium krabiense]|nr:hypothetical protein Skr01_05900 [Sphaerisporangium krabiense]